MKDTRLDNIVSMLIEFSLGNFDVRHSVTDEDDALNTVLSGLNMVGEELAHYKHELNNRNLFLQNIFRNIDELVYVRSLWPGNPDLSPFTFISARAVEIIGLTPEELENQPDKWLMAIHPDDRREIPRYVDELFNGQRMVVVYRIFHPIFGEYRWLEDSIIPVKGPDGITQLFGSARDITHRKRTEDELEDKSTLIERIIRASDQFFYVVSLDADASFQNNFTYFSPQIEQIQGSTPQEIYRNPMGWLQAIHPDDIEQVRQDNRHMFSTRQPVTRTYRVRHARTGRYIWLEDYVVPVADHMGLVRELYGSARDITERKEAAQQQEALIKELSNKNNELMQFNYIVSHNLRAPVAHIQGLARLLNMELDKQDVHTTIAYMQEAAQSLDHLLKDLNAILSVRSPLQEQHETFHLDDLIRHVCTTLKNEIVHTRADVLLDIHPESIQLTGIKSYIQSIFYNLISNAIKYRDTTRRPVIDIKAVPHNGRTRITVADNGLGIDMGTHRDKLFGLYSRFHRHIEGKGLGLYMTKTQIESLGGTIDASSTPGQGTVFTIVL